MLKKHNLFIVCSFLISAVNAQVTDQQKAMAENIKITGGGTFFKPRIMPNLTSLALAQVTVDFKTMSTKAVTKQEKKMTIFGKTPGKAATATVTAYLETTDGELGANDYQEIVNHFYHYFQQKLKESGVDTVGWDKITATDIYKEAAKPNNEIENDKSNAWVSYTANSGNEISNGYPAFGFGKQKAIGRTCKEFNAPVAFIYTTVDFAAIDVDVDVRSGYKSTWTPNASQTTTMKSKTNVSAFMKVSGSQEAPLYSTLMNDKLQAENVTVANHIPAEIDFATGLTEDPSRVEKQSKLFHVSFSKKMESAPVIISTTKEKYKTAAKKALENYVDTFIAKVVVMKND